MLTQDDILYFVVTDRFRDADPANNPGVDKQAPNRFHGGDFAGIVEAIPYLKALGVTALWITPVYLSIGNYQGDDGYHGYWAMDFERVDPRLHSGGAHAPGSREHLKDLVRVLHDNGLKVVLDVVVNHTGYHTQAYQAHQAAHPLLPAHWFQQGQGDWEKPLAGLPDLDHDNPDVNDYFVNNLLDWIEETRVDAIRMDTAKHVEAAFWYRYKAQVKGSHPEVTLLGEVLEWEVARIAPFQSRYDFDTLFDFPLLGAVVGCLVWDKPLTELARPRLSPDEPYGILDQDNPAKDGYTNANRLVTLLDNHDLNRRIASEVSWKHHGDPYWTWRVLGLCLCFQFTTRGIPQLYYGTEIGLPGWKEGDWSDGRGIDYRMRADFPWKPGALEPQARPEGMAQLALTKRLIALRKGHASLRYGPVITLYSDALAYVFLRYHRDDVVVAAINNGYRDMQAALPVRIEANSNIPGRIKRIITNGVFTDALDPGYTARCTGGELPLRVPHKTCRILTLS